MIPVGITGSERVKYEDKLKNSRPSLRETLNKRPLGRDPDRSWCHRHTTSMMERFWLQPLTPWDATKTALH